MAGRRPLVQSDQNVERADQPAERRPHGDEYAQPPTAPGEAMFRRTNSCGPENRSAVRLMPAVSTLIRVVVHMTTSRTNAATVRAMIWSRRGGRVRGRE